MISQLSRLYHFSSWNQNAKKPPETNESFIINSDFHDECFFFREETASYETIVKSFMGVKSKFV